MGIQPASTYEEVTVALEPGDLLTVYTDGITEASRTHHGVRDFFELAARIADEVVGTGPQAARPLPAPFLTTRPPSSAAAASPVKAVFALTHAPSAVWSSSHIFTLLGVN